MTCPEHDLLVRDGDRLVDDVAFVSQLVTALVRDAVVEVVKAALAVPIVVTLPAVCRDCGLEHVLVATAGGGAPITVATAVRQ